MNTNSNKAVVFSVIVPVFNTEQYIDECLESFICRQFTDYEIILIDDGSTDASGVICDKYAEKYAFVKVIHKSNGGVSDARNDGIKAAVGEYLIFLDSDDIMLPNALSDLFEFTSAHNADIILCDYIENKSGNDRVYVKNFISDIVQNSGITAAFAEIDGAPAGVLMYIFRRSLVVDNNIQFNKDYCMAEDADFLYSSDKYAHTYADYGNALICYQRQRDASATNSFSEKAVLSELNIYKKWFDYYKSNTKFRTFFANQFCKCICHTALCGEHSQITEFVKKNKYVLKFTAGLKYTAAKTVWGLFGYKAGSLILKFVNPKKSF